MRTTILSLAISGCLGSLAFAGPADAPNTSLPAGVTPKALNDQEDVRSVLASATNAAVVKDGIDDMVERFSSADRKRIGDMSQRDYTDLNGRIDQIRKNWEQKYGQSFDLNNAKLFERIGTIHEGEVTDAATAKTHWPVAVRATRDVPANTATSAEYLENGRNVAIVTVPASHDMPAITISMIHEPVDDWRIDLPDNITGDQVYSNVKTALTNLGDNVAAWPADVNDAYAAFGHRLLMAVYDVPQADGKSAAIDGR